MPTVPADLADAIAIIGMAGRFPGARDIDAFWRNLASGVESISFFDDADLPDVDPQVRRHPSYVKAKGVLEDMEWFDAEFFGYSAPEARAMDPQQRIFLESGWAALENAGYVPDEFPGAIGVYAGLSLNTYLLMNVHAHPELLAAVGPDKDFLATRLSYKLNLKGPSIVIQTSCSTSLVAICQACQGLLTFQCDMALAGGVSAMPPARTGYWYQEGSIASPDGHCRPFDAQANGTVFSSGIGVVVLKRLVEAVEDGDSIRAVIRGFAVNNDGAVKIGYTAPSVQGQAQVIATAIALANVDPATIGYVEAHGTGTDLGDPIEVAALTEAFGANAGAPGSCAIGSVKSNIGHLDAAAGVAGLIKTVLALEHRQIPPSLHFDQPNPRIDFGSTPFFVNTSLTEWAGPAPRRAGVSSFGIGGTNAHVVLEEAPFVEASGAASAFEVLTLSARTPAALDAATADLARHLRSHSDLNLGDVAYTLHVGRKRFPYSRAVACSSIDEACATLESRDPLRTIDDVANAGAPQVIFMFPGQGAHRVAMGRDVYRDQPTYRAHVDECCARLQPHVDWPVRDVLLADAEDARVAALLSRTAVAQSALFIVEYALAQLWLSWGIRPAAMIGHSSGEFAAACLAGVLELEEALKLLAMRGRLMEAARPGAMLAVAHSEQHLRASLPPSAGIAAVNAPGACVVSGAATAIEAYETQLRAQGIPCQRLATAGAFHSELMQDIVEPFVAAVARCQLGRVQIPYVSNVTGTWIRDEDAREPRYWGRHLRHTVRFAEGIETLLQWGGRVFLEVGPGATLTGLVAACARASSSTKPATIVPSLGREGVETPDAAALARALARLWTAGVRPDWDAVHAGQHRRRIALPAYPFERKRYWVDATAPTPVRELSTTESTNVERVAYAIPSWTRSLAPSLRSERAPAPRRILAFVDGPDHDRLAVGLERRGHDVTRVHLGSAFAQRGRDFVVDPSSPSDYRALVEQMRSTSAVPDLVLHLWSVTGPMAGHIDDETLDQIEARGFFGILGLVRAWNDVIPNAPLAMCVAVDGLHDVTGVDSLCPEKATVLGPCRVLPEEYGHVAIRVFDLPCSASGMSLQTLHHLAAEVESTASDPLVAFRGIDRLLPCMQPIALDAVDGAPWRLREGGVYLITGGFGAIGLEIARYLAKNVRARLVLVGRTAAPPRDRWDRHVSLYGLDDAVSRTISTLRTLEALGGEVMVGRADVASHVQMAAVLAEARERFGPINGVIHAAGVAGGGIAQLRDIGAMRDVMRPKVAGTRVLDRLLADEPLDFMVLCASVTGVHGGIGQIDYCAANAFLDVFARARTVRRGRFTVALDWDTWREAGMAVRARLPGDLARVHEQALARGLASADGVEAFRRCLSASACQVLVTSAVERDPRLVADGSGTDAPVSLAVATHERPALDAAFVAPGDTIQRRICELWQETLGIDRIGVHDSFFDLGGHSFDAIQMMSRVNANFGTAIPVARLYEGLTPAFLAELVRTTSADADEPAVALDGRADRVARQRRRQEERIAKSSSRRVIQ